MNKENTFVLSICIPTWNRADVLKKTLSKLIAGKSFDAGKVQIVISNNASADDTHNVGNEFAEKFPDRIKYCYHESGIDPHFNFQHALEMGDGEFIKLQTDYIFYEPPELDKLIGFLEKARAETGLFFFGNTANSEGREIHSVNDLLQELSFEKEYDGKGTAQPGSG